MPAAVAASSNKAVEVGAAISCGFWQNELKHRYSLFTQAVAGIRRPVKRGVRADKEGIIIK